eukprot:CAMPEP_0181368202 /NCGR_PEP_ID=MMETSP1106-20121128/11929_1 /TAXON_ID=81844 /ORGANISM="Mantoniella antarctica, Strain SL-175" /LENGTH=483 /DNA_ID=CAMNT_0023484237 /DNA_START=135 /DNA_END=1587 /DNA_ORIENTATION=-
MALSVASFAVPASRTSGATKSLKSLKSMRARSRPSTVAVRALKQNARTLHDSYNEHHGPEYLKYSGLDTTPDERVRRRAYYDKRTDIVRAHFKGSIGMDDWLFRVENKLNEFGFTGDNTIAMTSFCRDEITAPLKNGIHEIFGYAMDIDGLAGYCSAGVTGLGAGMSHSPTEEGSGKERYVFFAMPHIAVDSAGSAGDVIRAGRAGCSHACGALIAMQPKFEELKRGGMTIRAEGTCDHMNPEYSLLEGRMLRELQPEQVPSGGLDLVQVTKLCDGVIQKDFTELVRAAVDPAKADFAIITGVQIHSYGHTLDEWHPNMEYICPTSMTVVVNGKATNINLVDDTSAPTPRQLFQLRGGDTILATPTALAGIDPRKAAEEAAAKRRAAELSDEIARLTTATERASQSAAAALSALKSELSMIKKETRIPHTAPSATQGKAIAAKVTWRESAARVTLRTRRVSVSVSVIVIVIVIAGVYLRMLRM